MYRSLLVEDNAEFRSVLACTLKSEFHDMEVGEAESGEDALKLMQDRQPDLVLLDVQLPGISGFETAQLIRHCNHNVKVIILTGHDLPEYKAASLKCGADHFFSKNDSLHEILAAIRQLLKTTENRN